MNLAPDCNQRLREQPSQVGRKSSRLYLGVQDLAQRGLDLAAAIGVAIVLSRLGGQLGQGRQIGNPTRQRCCRGRDLLQDRLDLMETVSLVDHRVDVTTSAMPGALPPSKKPESTFRPCR